MPEKRPGGEKVPGGRSGSMERALDFLRHASDLLKRHGIRDSAREAETVVSACAGIDRVALYRDNPPLDASSMQSIAEALSRRAKREPLQYILGKAEFYGLSLKVGPGVLIPRPETELLVEEALKFLKEKAIKNPLVLDICTGCGPIAIAVGKNYPGSFVTGTDNSPRALAYARENALENGADNVTFLEGPLLEPAKGMTFDLMLCNPPYIRTSEIDGLQPEIRDWEPRGALDGGPDGYYYYGKLYPDAGEHLKPGGQIMLEMGNGQLEGALRIARLSGFKLSKTVKDYSGIERIAVFKT